MNVMLVVGLPASGKTHWAKKEVAQLRAVGAMAGLLDDPRTQDQLTEALSQPGHTLFVTDPYLCLPEARKAANEILTSAGHRVFTVFFANDPAQCLVNAGRRQDMSVTKFINSLAQRYEVPNGAVTFPVYRESL